MTGPVRLLLIVLLLAPLSAACLYVLSPPKLLDMLDELTPGEGGAVRIGAGVAFRPGAAGKLDIWSTPARPGEARKPVLIFFYGGAWVSGRRQDYGFVGRAYAARGFVVVLPDYRKVPAARFPTFVEDGAAAVRWVRDNIARYGGDPRRIGVAGHSAGAYIAILLALDRHYLADVGIDPGAVRAAAGFAGPYDFYPFDSPRAVAAMGAWPDPRATQPITFARKDAPPLFLATGGADTTVRPANALALAARERALGNATTVLRAYPGLDHAGMVMALSKPFRARATVLDDSAAFLHARLAPR